MVVKETNKDKLDLGRAIAANKSKIAECNHNIKSAIETYLIKSSGYKTGDRFTSTEGKTLIVELLDVVEENGEYYWKAVCLNDKLEHGTKMRVMRDMKLWKSIDKKDAERIRKEMDERRRSSGTHKNPPLLKWKEPKEDINYTQAEKDECSGKKDRIKKDIEANKAMYGSRNKTMIVLDDDKLPVEVIVDKTKKSDGKYDNLKAGQAISACIGDKWIEGTIINRLPKEKGKLVKYNITVGKTKVKHIVESTRLQIMVAFSK